MNDVRILVAASAIVYGILALAMGVFPGLILSRTTPTPGLAPFTPQQLQGRDIYVSEGCAYCHTQQVRPLAQDRVFGRPAARGDFAYSTPELLGSERNGPDLSNVGARQPSAIWQYIHLYQPRSLVSASIMPSYAWLFEVKAHAAPGDLTVPVPAAYVARGHVVVASPDAQALVAYLLALKQAPLPKAKP
jgi:cytochrome c oxidase cbb3-type subunit 2